MILGDRLRIIREAKRLTQADIEQRAGLSQGYVSRVENGEMVPSAPMLEKWSQALGVPLNRLSYDFNELPELPNLPNLSNLPKRLSADDIVWSSSRKQLSLLCEFRRSFRWMNDLQRKLLLSLTEKIASSKRGPRPKV